MKINKNLLQGNAWKEFIHKKMCKYKKNLKAGHLTFCILPFFLA